VRDLLLIGLYALLAGGVVALTGAGVLRLLRGRSITLHIVALLVITVGAVVAGVAAVARAMFLSAHDLQVVLVTVSAAAVVSLAVGTLFGRRLARAATWAAWPGPRPGRRTPRRGGASWSPGFRTICVRRWPASARWPRRWRTASCPTRSR
jgi:hypothetical protein